MRPQSKTLFRLLVISTLIGLVCAAIQPTVPVHAAAGLTVTPITWDVIGLDSNDAASGPKNFPVGVRVCNSTGAALTNVRSNFYWDSANPDIILRPGSLTEFTGGNAIPTLANGACTEFYYEVEVDTVTPAYDTFRRYHITVTAFNGVSDITSSSPTPRQLFIEHLVSQSRNATYYYYLNGVPIPPGGTMAMTLGNTYVIRLEAMTATNGYEQIESFINFPNTIFQVLGVSTTYSAETSPNITNPHPRLYGDACLWDPNPISPTYRSCLGTGKAGGTVVVDYTIKIIGGSGTSSPLYSLIYDFSGSSYHYNQDMMSSFRIGAVVDPTSLTISKNFSPDPTVAGGTSKLTFTLTNPNAAAISGVNFTDTFPTTPGLMVVANPTGASTIGCGTPTFAPVAGAGSISFSNGTIGANSTCTISVNVTVPTTGTYTNTSGNVFVGTTDTGKKATDTLTVTASTPAPTCIDMTMATWEMNPTSTTVPPAPTVNNVGTAVASIGSGITQTINTSVGNPVYSWSTNGYPKSTTYTTTDVVRLRINTIGYTNVHMLFEFRRTAQGPKNLQVGFSDTGVVPGTFKQSYSLANPDVWYTTDLDFTGQTSTTGDTSFFIQGANAQNSGASALLYLDNIKFIGCGTPTGGIQPVTMSKSFSPNPVAVNGTSTLTFTITNPNASFALTGLTFTDTLPAGLQVAATPAAATTCNFSSTPTWAPVAGSTTLTFGSPTAGSVAAGGSCTVSVNVTATTAGAHPNVSGFISSTETGTNATSTGYGSDSLTALLPPTIEKTFTANPIPVNGITPIEFNITNPNPVQITGVNFTDTLPTTPGLMVVASPLVYSTVGCGTPTFAPTAGSGVLSFTGGTIAADSVCTVRVNVTAPVAGDYVNTTGAVDADIVVGTDTATDTLTVEPGTPGLALLKQIGPTASGPWTKFLATTAGTGVYYQFTVENTGDVDLTSVTISDPTLGSLGVSCTWASIPKYESRSCVFGPYSALAGDHTNTASANGFYGTDPVPSNTSSARYATTALLLNKEADTTILPAAGETITYSYYVMNIGSAPLAGPMVVTDDKATVTCPALTTVIPDGDGDLDPGEAITCEATYTVTAGDVTAGGVTNTAFATIDGVTSNTDSVTVGNTDVMPDVRPTKVVDDDSIPETGQEVTFTFTVSNDGTEAFTIDSLVDDQFGVLTGDSDCQVGTILAAGTSCTFDYTTTLLGDAPSTHTNVVTVDVSDGDGDTDTATATETVTFEDVLPDVSVTKVVDDDSIPETGQSVTFTFTVTNNGTEAATIDSLTDSVFGVLTGDADCQVGTVLAAGASCEFTYTTTLTGDAPDVHSNTITVVASDGDGNTDTATATETVTFEDVLPDVSVTKVVDDDSIPETGQSVTFTFTVTNNGTEAATIDSLTDSVFGALTGDADCQVGTVLAAGASCEFTYSTTLTGDAPDVHSNTITVVVSDGDGNTDTATATETVTFEDVLPDVSVTKVVDDDSIPETGQSVTFTFTVTNNGTEAATIDSLTDSVFGALTGDADCQVGTVLAAGASCEFTYSTTLTGDAPDVHSNTITVVVSDGDGNTDTATATETVTFEDVLPDVSVTKVVDDDSIPETGQSVTFTFTVTNNGTEAATIDSLSDDVFTTVTGDADCQVGTVLAASGSVGDSCEFTYTTTLTGDAPDVHSNTITVVVSDGDGNTDTATATETVTFEDVLPDVSVTKVVDDDSIPETGQSVTFTFTVTNNGTEAATIDSLSDDVFTTVTGDADCQVGTVLAASGSVGDSCEFTYTTTLTGDAPDVHSNTITVVVSDGDGNTDTATATETVTFEDVLPDVSVTKVVDDDSIPETGQSVTFTFTVTNNGTEAATIDSLTDSVFGALTGDADCQVGTVLAAGASCEFTYSTTLTGDAPDVHSNTITVVASDGDGNTDTATATETVTFEDVLPDVSVTKVVDDDSIPETGQSVTFTFTVTNNGTEAATIDSLTDSVFGALTGDADCQVGTVLAAGASCEFTYSTTLTGDAPDVHSNTITVVASDGDGNTDTATATETVTFEDVLPDVSVTKVVDDDSIPETGQSVTFTFTVTNNGTEAATIDSLTDSVFGALTGDADCQVGTVLAAGASCEFTYSTTLTGDAPDVHSNTITVVVSDGDGNTDTATATETVTFEDVLPDVSVTKVVDDDSIPETGQSVTFTFTVTNNGTEAATIDSLTDSVFGALTGDADCQVGTVLAAGASCEFTYTTTLTGDAPDVHSNTITVVVSDGDGNTDTATATETVTFEDVLPDVSITKTASPTSVPETGGSVTFTFTVTNNGLEAFTITSLSDTVYGPLTGDADCQVGTVLAPAASCSFSFTDTLSGNAPATHDNTVTVGVADNDDNTDSDSDDETVTFTEVLPDVTITKTADATSIPETGQLVTFTFVVTNTSTEPATITVLNDSVFGPLTGDADCQVGTVLAASGSCSFEYSTTLTGTAPGTHNNTVTVTVEDEDGTEASDSDDETVTFTDVPVDLTITKTDGVTQTTPGATLTYTLTIENVGGRTATGVVVTDTIPNGTSFVSASNSGTEVGGVVTWPTFDLAAGATVTRQVTVLVDDPLDVTILSIINTASVTDDGSNGDDPTPDDNTATDTDSLGLAGKDLLWEGPQDNTGMPLVRIGEMFTYRVVLGVAPGATLENLVLTDVLDRGLVFMNCAVSGGSLTADPAHPFGNMCAAPIPVSTEPSGSTNPADVGRKLTLNFGTVVNPSTEAGDFITVYYDVVVLNSAENVQGLLLNNAAEWSWDGGSYPLTARDVKVVEPKLDIVKTVTPTEVMPGQEVTFTMTIEHTTASEIDAYDVVLTDKVPSGLTYVPGSLQFISGQTPTLIDESGAPTLRVSWDVFADNNQKTIIRFKATVDAIGAGDSVKNVANLAWSSMPGDWSDPITPISPVLSTERFFTPGSSINTYGANSSASLGVPEEVVLPETGFAPGKVTPLGQQPADAYHEITDLVLEIPSLKVSTGIVGVPLKGGEWDLTWLGTQAGYLEGTSFPTWAGNSAITAHVYNADGKPGPFNQLGTLKWGDVVKVKAFGLTYTYAVRSVAVVQPGDLSVLKHEDMSWLTLITCKGYNIAEDSYSQRVVVRAVLVNVGAE